MAETLRASQSEDKMDWVAFHKQDKRSRAKEILAASGLFVVGLIGYSIISDSGSDAPAEAAPTSTTEVPPTTSDTRESHSFMVGDRTFNCRVAASPHVVIEGDNIWEIVEGQQAPDMPQRWVGTVVLNQARGTVGDNPDLIYPGNNILVLEDCAVA